MHKNERSNKDYWQLYKSFCEGNKRASHELVKDIGNRLKNYMLRWCRDEQNAENCVQITFEKLWKKCSKSMDTIDDEERGFWGYVLKIAVNTMKDIKDDKPPVPGSTDSKTPQHTENQPYDNQDDSEDSPDGSMVIDDQDITKTEHEKENTVSPTVISSIEDHLETYVPKNSPFNDPEIQYTEDYLNKLFKETLYSLSQKQRQAYFFWRDGRYSLKEIAAIMCEKEETVKNYIRTAKKKLALVFDPILRG